MNKDITLILEDRKKYEAIQNFKKWQELDQFRKKTSKTVFVLFASMALILYAIVCMTA